MPVIGWLDNAAPTADHRQVPQPKIHGPRTQIARGAIRLLDQGLIALLRCLPQSSPPRMVPGCVPGIGFGPARHAPSLSWLYGKSTPPPSHVRCWQAKPTPWSWVARRARPVGAGAREIYAGLRINITGRTRARLPWTGSDVRAFKKRRVLRKWVPLRTGASARARCKDSAIPRLAAAALVGNNPQEPPCCTAKTFIINVIAEFGPPAVT